MEICMEGIWKPLKTWDSGRRNTRKNNFESLLAVLFYERALASKSGKR